MKTFKCNFNLFIKIEFSSAIIFIWLLIWIFASPSFSQQNEIGNPGKMWIGTWTTSPQLVEERNNPPSPGLTNNTIRQIVRISLGGDSLRVKFTNEFSTNSVTMKEIRIALSTGNGSIDTTTQVTLLFNGKKEITMEPGSTVTSDPFEFFVIPKTDIAITTYFGKTSPDVTGHPGSRTTSYILTGNQVGKKEFVNAVTTEHWYVINGIDIKATDESATLVVLGNSITDGRGSGTNKQNRWTDILAERLLANPETQNIAVLNAGIGGNCVTKDCLGPSALSRFERDVLKQCKVKWLIILEGVNDIGGAQGFDGAESVAKSLIGAYEKMIDEAHSKGILVYGATIMPFGTSFYDSEEHRLARQIVNDWIRNSGRFDAVIDMAAIMSKADNHEILKEEGDTGDHLHPNEEGHRMMAESVDLKLFMRKK